MLAALALVPGARGGEVADQLPDLVQRVPFDLAVTTAGPEGAPRHRLVFGSAVENLGPGPLIVEGQRADRATRAMTARQVIRRTDGSRRVRPRVGVLRFVRSEDHRHWHLLGFDRYELRRAGERGPLLRDRKSGFCLGDRYAIGIPDAPRPAFASSRCGADAPRLLRVREGISPGFGDDYDPALEGQYLDITDLAAGRYVLVHRVNERGTLLENDYGNNAASVLIRLSRPLGKAGKPRIAVLRRCPGTDSCRS